MDIAALTDRLDGRTVCTVESCTAGRVAALLAAGDGASEWFSGGIVAYRERTKREVLGVTADSVYCEEAASQMAVAGARELQVDAAVATTGVAGPDPVEGVPPGTVFIATVVDGATVNRRYLFDGDPAAVLDAAAKAAVMQLTDHLAHA